MSDLAAWNKVIEQQAVQRKADFSTLDCYAATKHVFRIKESMCDPHVLTVPTRLWKGHKAFIANVNDYGDGCGEITVDYEQFADEYDRTPEARTRVMAEAEMPQARNEFFDVFIMTADEFLSYIELIDERAK